MGGDDQKEENEDKPVNKEEEYVKLEDPNKVKGDVADE